jgi:hypothetical protein
VRSRSGYIEHNNAAGCLKPVCGAASFWMRISSARAEDYQFHREWNVATRFR